MSDLLLEIYGEEIPSSAQILAEKQLFSLFHNLFESEKINFSIIETYSTPRRISLIIKNLKEKPQLNFKEIRGPSTSANPKALEGFLKSNKISDLNKLIKKKINNKEYYFFLKKNKQEGINNILNSKIPTLLSSIKWQKSMRWSYNDERWCRPIKSILATLDGKKLNFSYAGIQSNFFTYGNYHYTKQKIKCNEANHYKKIMKKNNVLINSSDRSKKIRRKLESFCKRKKLKSEFQDSLVKRIANSVEYINVFFASFDKKYFELPDFLLETIITEKQDNFCFKDTKGNLSNFFSFVSNKKKSNQKNLIEGNLNVLKARFSDANFFIKEDLKIKLSNRLEKLSSIVFYDNMGSLYERSFRITKLAEILSSKLSVDIKKFKEQLIFSNFDLTTEIVKEYPSLQGSVGGYYAKKFGLYNEVIDAFSNQYKINLKRKKIDLAIILSIAQKIDSIFGFFSSNKKISGSGDPFGIRRITISLINISIDNNLNINFNDLLESCKKLYIDQGLVPMNDFSTIIDFFNKRIETYLSDMDYDYDVIKCNLKKQSFNPLKIFDETKMLKTFLISTKGKKFLQAFKRLDSIVGDDLSFQKINQSLFEKKEEFELFKCINDIKNEKNIGFLISHLDKYEKISNSINVYLDNVMVNTENQELKKNRKSLLAECKIILSANFNFSQLKINE